MKLWSIGLSWLENIGNGKTIVEQLFSHVVEKKVMKVVISYKACATIDFGEDLQIEVETSKGGDSFTRGEWCLWLYACHWRLDQSGEPVVGSGDSEERICENLPLLEGKKLLRVKILNNAFDLIADFEEGFQLRVFCCEVEEGEPWTLSTPDKMVFSVGGGNKWAYESSFQ